MKIIYQARTSDGDVQELVLDRDPTTAPPSAEDEVSRGHSVQDTVQHLLAEADKHLQANGLVLTAEQRSQATVELTLAVLDNQPSLHLPATLANPDASNAPDT